MLLDAFDRGNFSTRWRTYCVGAYLQAHGCDVQYYHLLLTGDEVPGLRLLPRIVRQTFLRLSVEWRAWRARTLCRKADRIVVLNAYTSAWLPRFLATLPNGYVYDTVDFADTEDFIRLHCATGWRGALQRWRMRRNARVFLEYIDHASLVCTNNFHCAQQAEARGKRTHQLIDPIPCDYLTPLDRPTAAPPLTFGWTGHPATNHYMREYLGVFRELADAGLARFEFMEGDRRLAAEAGAAVVPWTVETFKARVPQWHAGIAPLPSHIEFKGKFPGKIVQYMAAGLPSIVTPKGMATHFIRDGETGLYAETSDDWRRCLRYLIEHPDEAQRMGCNARRDFEQRFSLEAQMPAYLRVVLEI